MKTKRITCFEELHPGVFLLVVKDSHIIFDDDDFNRYEIKKGELFLVSSLKLTGNNDEDDVTLLSQKDGRYASEFDIDSLNVFNIVDF